MRYVIFIFSLFISQLSIAQDLVEFENGRIADANDLNRNMQLLMDEVAELKGRAAALEIENCVALSELGDGVLIGDQENQFGINDQLTIAAWIRQTGDCPGQRCEIVSLEQTNWAPPESWSSGVALFTKYEEGQPMSLTLRYKYEGGRQTRVIGYSQDLEIGRWMHVAGVLNPNSVHLFVNGKALDEVTAISYVDGAWEELNFPQGLIDFNGNSLDHSYSWIGRGFPNGLDKPSLEKVFVGSLARLGVWSTALTANEIRQLYSNTLDVAASAPAGFWPLNETNGDVAVDLSIGSNNGLLEGSAMWSESCRNSGISSY